MKTHYPVVIISDTHLGMRNGAAELLAEFLDNITCDRLILNGDIIDGQRINARRPKKFTEAQARAIDAVNRKVAEGGEVIYIPGNHDAHLRRLGLFGTKVMGIRFENQLEMTDAKGRRLLVTHGDRLGPMPGIAYDMPLGLRNLVYDYTYVALTRISSAMDKIGHTLLRRHFGLAAKTRRRIETHNGHRAARENMATHYARQEGYDGIICGHFHAFANRVEKDGLLYLNSGDWVENYTALTMNADGDWNVLDWGAERTRKGLKRAFFLAASPNPDLEFRPQTEKMLEHICAIWPGRRDRATSIKAPRV